MIYDIGSKVLVRGMRGIFTVLEGPNRKGLYLVSLEAIKFWVTPEKMSVSNTRAESGSLAGNKDKKPRTVLNAKLDSAHRHALDLHGLTVAQATDELEKHLSDMLIIGINEFDIIHGLGTGAIKNAVHKYLAAQTRVLRFNLSVSNPGITIVYL